MNKILFVINPVAGKGRGHEVIPKIAEHFSRSRYEIIVSSSKGGIEALVKEKINNMNFTSVIAVGGDGTLMETMNGLMDYNGNIGIIPIGSGNDFAKTLGIKEDINTALSIIKEGHTKEIYSGWVNNQRFLNVVGIGIDALIIDYKDKSKILKGKLNYLAATIKGIFRYKGTKLVIKIDGTEYHTTPLFIAIGNGKYIGNGMKITPGADLTSDTFEICMIKNLKKRTLLKNITNLYKGLHGKVEGVDFVKGSRISVDFNELRPVDVDGNLITCKSVDIRKSDKKIKFIVKG
jgi:YegS/Rv2252/BmrU family lipid kinase